MTSRSASAPTFIQPMAPYNSADYLDNEKVIAEYLAAAMEDPNPDVFLLAVSNVAKARGMA